MPIWTSITGGIRKGLGERKARQAEQRKVDQTRALELLKEVLKGTIEPTAEPSEAVITGPRRRVAPEGIGQRIMEGFGIGQPQYEPGQMYRRPPVTAPTVGPEEKITTRYGPRGKVAGYTVSPEAETKPTEWQLQKEAQDEAFRQLGGSFMVGLDEESRREYETLSNQIYQNLRKQYGYTGRPETRPTPEPTEDKRTQYNRLRSQGVSAEEAKRQLGIR